MLTTAQEQFPEAVKQQIFNELLKTPAGRVKMAMSMIMPLRTRRDYASVARKAFLVEQLPDGALPLYDRDPEVVAYMIGEEGASIISQSKPKRVIFPLFEIAANPQMSLTEVKNTRYDLIQRNIDLGKSEVQAQEDTKAFAVMDAAAADPRNANPDITVTAPITVDVLADAFGEVEFHDLVVQNVFMNARDFTDIRKFGRDTLDIESQAALLKTGLQATLWGARIIVSRIVPVGQAYICAEKGFFGRIPVRTEMTVISADNPQERMIGFSIFENIGIGSHNPAGLTRLIINR
jgi:hypothetical protein